jgi:ABC-type multidrug transport system fused ATPase/permease subunit
MTAPQNNKDSLHTEKPYGQKKGFFPRMTDFFSRLFYIVSLVWETAPFILILMALLCLFEGVLPVIGAYISRYLINSVAELIGTSAATDSVYHNLFTILRPVLFVLLLQLIYIIMQKVIERLGNAVTVIAGELVVNHIKLKIIGKAKEVDQSSFDRPSFYEKLENANREAGMRPIQILRATFSVISSAISVISFIVVLATLSPIAPLVILISAIPGAIVTYIYRNRNFRYMRRHSRERREMNYYSDMMVNKDAAKEIKLLGLGDTFIGKYKSAFSKYFKGLKQLAVRENSIRILVSVISALANCLIFAYVAYDVVFNKGLIGDYSLYTGALSSVMGSVTAVVAATATIYEGTLFIDNMIEFMKETPKIVPIGEKPLIPSRKTSHTIEFKNVSFIYPGTDIKVIDNLNLTFKTGERIVLVGLNGAGKTTLIKLLTRLYDPTEGQILLDGEDLKKYDPKAYYDMFGIIFQDFGKYAVTAKENIQFGDVDNGEDMEKIESSAKASDADFFIRKLPAGYDTPLTRMFEENGIELSGGQWQKLSVARAFYKDSDFLILDEPTASLDAIAEQKIFDQFSVLSEGKLSIFVSHRLSSATSADRIVVLGAGRLIELGTHEELMARKGEYYHLFSTQAKRYQ